MSIPIQIKLFGAPTVSQQGKPLIINRFQIRAFLFRLAAQPEPVPRELITQLFWPHAADAPARRHLTQLLSHVRRSLPMPGLLIQSPTHVHLDWARVWCDVVIFQRDSAPPGQASGAALQALIDLYGGPFLDGFSASALPEYELWLLNERVWLERRYLDLLELRTLDLMAQEAFLPAIALLKRHLDTDELAEGAHRRLIACYAATGDRAAAARQYQRCAALLQQELDVPPMAETIALQQAVHNGAAWPELRALALSAYVAQPDAAQTIVAADDAPPALRANLPHEPLPIIGRTAELAALTAMLADPQNRLITIVGVGGMGKTRLALAAAQTQRQLDHFTDGIYFVALAALTDPTQIVPTILQTLRLATGADTTRRRTPFEQLVDFLRAKQMLLLLDNFEHLLAGADVVAQIAQAAPDVHLLVTSRKVLGVHGEQLFPLSELPYPATDDLVDAITSADPAVDPATYPAVQLFVQSARRSVPTFGLTNKNLADVVRICQLVGGMPLALELAASWITMLSTADIGVEIARSLDFLEAEIRDVPLRHQSMRALLDAIWQQMNAAERAVFARLGVFQGGYTRQAAAEVAGASLRTLRSLTANLLIRYNEKSGRYSSHELLRAYSAEQLAAQPTVRKEVRERHIRYYSARLVRLAPELKGPRQQHAFAELVADQANLQLAWEGALAHADLNRLEETIAGLGYFYEWIGSQIDGANIFSALVNTFADVWRDDDESACDLVENLDVQTGKSHSVQAGLDHDDEARGRRARLLAQGLAWLASFTLMAGNVNEAEAQLKCSLALLDKATALGVDCRRQRALTLLHSGHLERPRDLAAAARAYEMSVALYAQIALPWESAYASSWLGETHHLMGQQEAAIELLTQARRAFEAVGDQRNVARVLATVADCYLLDRAELKAAQETAAASLHLWRAIGDQLGIANTAVILAYAHCWLNRPDLAEPLIDEALAIYRHHGHRYGECRVYYMMMVAANYRSDIAGKEASARQGLKLARELGDAKLVSDFSRGLANVYMARGDYASAYPLHAQAIAVQEEAGVQALMPWLHVVRGYSSWKTGKWTEARDHLAYALRVSAENDDVFTAVYAVFFVAQVLQAQGRLERALELYALAQRAYMWQGSLSGDVIMVQPLLTLEDALPPAVAAAARERGHALDLLATAAQLAAEIQEPTWQWS
ncbi:MAG: BTAD domain-containing putative transcriptional regulator [Caldilineaceae bacterium]